MKKFLVTLIAVTGLVACNQDKIVFVDRTKLLEEYQERKDIESKYKDKVEKYSMKKDSISKAFELEYQDFQKRAQSMAQAKAEEEYKALSQKTQFLSQQFQQQEYLLNQDSQKEADSLIKKVNKFVEKYGKDKGYTYILGANEAGSVMYGEKSKDITEEVLKAINDEYARN